MMMKNMLKKPQTIQFVPGNPDIAFCPNSQLPNGADTGDN